MHEPALFGVAASDVVDTAGMFSRVMCAKKSRLARMAVCRSQDEKAAGKAQSLIGFRACFLCSVGMIHSFIFHKVRRVRSTYGSGGRWQVPVIFRAPKRVVANDTTLYYPTHTTVAPLAAGVGDTNLELGADGSTRRR